MSLSVDIRVGAGYRVEIARGSLERCGAAIAGVCRPCRAAVITDSTVSELYLEKTLASLRTAGFDTLSYVFPQGEQSKNIATLTGMLEFLAGNRLTRSDIIVALGGGVTGDMAGFAAAVYLRGVRYVQIPTTLLAAVDSSVGGKTAVDLTAGKNLAGAVHQPSLVVCDPDTLSTLPPHIFADGAAESIKYGVLSDREIFGIFERGEAGDRIDEIISRCVAIKGSLVEQDEHDTGVRRFLNLGHTIGHAIEKVSDFSVSHGHAVAIGMVMMARAGEKLGYTAPGTAERISRVLTANSLPSSAGFRPEALLDAALSDKKRSGGDVTVVMPQEIGRCELMTMPVEKLGELIRLGSGV